MQRASIITTVEPSCNSHVVLSPKKDGGPMLRVDFCRLNVLMKRDRRTVLRVDEISEKVKKSIVFMTIFLFQCYREMKIDEKCKETTAFI